MVSYPYEWNEFFDRSAKHLKTFRADTPQDIIDKAKVINEKCIKYSGKPLFYFEEENEEKV